MRKYYEFLGPVGRDSSLILRSLYCALSAPFVYSPPPLPMANTLAMGPPLSPRETRRSGRRSNQSSGSSKSPASPPGESSQLPPARPSRETSSHNSTHRPPLSTSHSSGRNKRPKQEDIDDAGGDGMAPNGVSAGANGRGKRKTGAKPPDIIVEVTSDVHIGASIVAVEGEEEPSVTRCVCGSTGE